jgi:tetratricopeptide (TPR) repeat protein
VKALEALDSANPDNVRVLVELGRARLAADKAKDAEKALKKALKISSDLPLAHVLIGDVYFTQGKYSKASKSYKTALESDNSNVAAHLRLALCLHRMKKSSDALEILGNLISEENLPNVVAGHWLIALIRVDLERYEDALKAMDKVLEIDKDDYQALIGKGQILLQAAKPAEAAKIFSRAVELFPRSGEALFCLGWANEKAADAPEIQETQKRERLVAAAEAYARCTELDPGVRPRDSLGFVHLLSDEHRDAVIQFERAKDIDPKFAPAVNNLGLASDIADNRAEAKKRYNMVLGKIDKNNVRARVMLALDLWLDGSHSKAIKELEKALKIAPEDDLAWTFLGDVHYDMRKHERAIRAYKKATEINDKAFIAWYHMGIAYEDKRKDEEADRCYRKALEAKADPPLELVLRVAEINDEGRLDKLEDAVKFYELYVQLGGTAEWVPDRITELKEILSS